MKLRKCPNCKNYTMMEICPYCKTKTINPLPPKYSPEDKFGKLRRMFIKELESKSQKE
ncbi:MAG: RNA-protein complex protein Nop10 [Candidatus Aenigmatarchaeota archaeon]|jgi:H/ACA ribonucleoprotein complex subunit 3